MVRLSSRERYALRALFDLAFHGDAAPAQVKDIAARQRIPARFLEQILQDLKRAGLVRAKRGPHGGYRLTRAPGEIHVTEVLRATSGPVAPPERRSRRSAADLGAVTDAFVEDLARSVERHIDTFTLEDVCARGERLGLRRAQPTSSYAI